MALTLDEAARRYARERTEENLGGVEEALISDARAGEKFFVMFTMGEIEGQRVLSYSMTVRESGDRYFRICTSQREIDLCSDFPEMARPVEGDQFLTMLVNSDKVDGVLVNPGNEEGYCYLSRTSLRGRLLTGAMPREEEE